MSKVSVIGAGLAGCEAAWALARRGIDVTLYEMKPVKYSPAHHYEGFAELVCSNSLKAMRLNSAAGLLKAEMKAMDSLVVRCAEQTAVSAGGALAVDREAFSDAMTKAIRELSNVTVVTGEVTELPAGNVIVASGPLTSEALSETIGRLCGEKYLSFYDASAPIVTKDSIDMERVYFATRYDRGEADYINCSFNKEEYEAFHEALVNAKSVELHEFEKEYFKVYEGCMPIEVLAKRGLDTMRYGPLRPVGLRDPRTGHRPWANIQLRRENADGTMYNIVGFQTNLLFPEQKRIVNLRSQVTMALKKYRPQADDTRLLAELSAIASTLKSASLTDIEMRGFTFDQKRQTLHLQLRAANFASFDKLRSALAADYVVQQDALQKEGDVVSGGVTLRRK